MGWWGLLTVSCPGKHWPGQCPSMWDDRLPCWCRPFLEVRARQDWSGSLHPPVDMKYLPWHPVERGGDSIKNSADTCRRRLALHSRHQQSHFHWTGFQRRPVCLLYLVLHFPFPSCFTIKRWSARSQAQNIHTFQKLSFHYFPFSLNNSSIILSSLYCLTMSRYDFKSGIRTVHE